MPRDSAQNGDFDAVTLTEEFRKAADTQKKAEIGNAQAGKEKDYADTFELARKSATQDNGYGLYALALAYEHGRGVEADVDKALECYRRGTELGNAHCMHNLGCFYMRGDHVREDKDIGLLDVVLLEMDPGSKYTLQEITEFPGVPVEVTPRFMNERVISPLISQGKLHCVSENGRTYFKLP